MLKCVGVMLCLVGAVLCDDCKPVPVKPEFDSKQMAGTWYLQYRSKFHKSIDEDYKCLIQHHIIRPDGTILTVDVHLKNSGPKNSDGHSYIATAIQNTTDGVLWYEMWGKGHKEIGPLRIIDIDYKDHLLTYFCHKGIEGAWIFTRSKEIGEETMKAIKDGLEGAKLSLDDYQAVPLDSCP